VIPSRPVGEFTAFMRDYELVVRSEHLTAGEKNAVIEQMAQELLTRSQAPFVVRIVKRLLETPVREPVPPSPPQPAARGTKVRP
jgi:hypothetical protein